MTTAAGTPRILVVEDDAITRESLTELLRGKGYSADGARDGTGAAQLLGLHRYDALVVDAFLGASGVPVDGMALARLVRERESFRGLPVVLITAAADDDAREMARELHTLRPAALLRKPFEIQALLSALEALLRKDGGP